MFNLGKLKDIFEFMIGGENGVGYEMDNMLGSEYEIDVEVEVFEMLVRKVYSFNKLR